jgi:hypothetical protein
MSKLKGIIIVIILVGVGGAATFFWLTKDRQKQVLDQANQLIKNVDQQFLSTLKVQTFEIMQGLSVHTRSEALLNPLVKVQAAVGTAGAPVDETQKNAFTSARTDLLAALEDIQKKAASDEVQKRIATEPLMILTTDGKILAQIPDKEKYGTSLKGLPTVEKCLQGIALDGIYELDGILNTMATAPLIDKNGKIAGCLAAVREFGLTTLTELSKTLGMELAVFTRKTVVVSTIGNSIVQPLAEQLESKDPVWFGESPSATPWLINLTGRAFLAHLFQIPSGTDPLYVSAILPVAELFTGLKDAQNRLLLGLGILFIIGLLLAFVLTTERESDKELERLRDGVKSLLQGDKSNTFDATRYAGPYRELARDIASLAGAGFSHKTFSAKSDSISDLLGSLPTSPLTENKGTAGSPLSEALDFDKLLDTRSENSGAASDVVSRTTAESSSPLDMPSLFGTSPTSPRVVEPTSPSEPESLSEEPTVAIPSPMMPFQASPTVESVARSQPAYPAPGGPRVELPTDLVGIFDERIDTREIKPIIPASGWPERLPQESPRESPMRVEPTPPLDTQPAPSPSKLPPYQSPTHETGIEDPITSSDYRPDETIIAAVPDELLRASSTLNPQETLRSIPTNLPKPPSISMPPSMSLPPISGSTLPPPVSSSALGRPPSASVSESDEGHLKEIFDQFVKTKNQCGESTVGLTIEPFIEKLRKNTAELKSRYKCSTVKFQVYVKNGKAALKATPIK